MAETITLETIDYVSILAKLKLTPEETEGARSDMQKMLDYVEKLNELDTDGVEPMTHLFPYDNVFREDIVTNRGCAGGNARQRPEDKRWPVSCAEDHRVGGKRG